MPLSKDKIDELLGLNKPDSYGHPQHNYSPPNQTGPVRFHRDRRESCINVYEGGTGSYTCGAPSYHSFHNKPMCMLHILMAANAELVEMGVLE